MTEDHSSPAGADAPTATDAQGAWAQMDVRYAFHRIKRDNAWHRRDGGGWVDEPRPGDVAITGRAGAIKATVIGSSDTIDSEWTNKVTLLLRPSRECGGAWLAAMINNPVWLSRAKQAAILGPGGHAGSVEGEHWLLRANISFPSAERQAELAKLMDGIETLRELTGLLKKKAALIEQYGEGIEFNILAGKMDRAGFTEHMKKLRDSMAGPGGDADGGAAKPTSRRPGLG